MLKLLFIIPIFSLVKKALFFRYLYAYSKTLYIDLVSFRCVHIHFFQGLPSLRQIVEGSSL